MNDKITQSHRDRGARVYIRQSSAHQVRNHHQGRQRQYDLAPRASERERTLPGVALFGQGLDLEGRFR